MLSQWRLGELVIKSPARLTALAKPCSPFSRDAVGAGAGNYGFASEARKSGINKFCLGHELAIGSLVIDLADGDTSVGSTPSWNCPTP